MKSLTAKGIKSLREDGIRITARKCRNYIRDYVNHNNSDSEKSHRYVDVLFINGCALPHPARYRVTHQMEQLLMANVTSECVFYEDLNLSWVNYARVFVFFRCPYTDIVGEFIKIAKDYNKNVIFDIDDLVFDTVYTDTVKYVNSMKETDRKVYDNGVKRIMKTLALCDYATTTTEALAEELSKYTKTVYINRNVASDSMLAYSNDALKHLPIVSKKDYKKIEVVKKIPGQISLGYFSGSITHNDDFSIVLSSIKQIMQENSKVHLYLVGELNLPEDLQIYKNRIHTLGFMDWIKLPYVIAQMDINLAPLEDTLFNRAKSENKWLEAALVQVVTIASDVGAFAKMIKNEETGILCKNTSQDWYNSISRMILDPQVRRKIGEKAYSFVVNNCITLETCYAYAEFIKSVMSPNVIFKIPNAQISGGILVAQKHASYLQKNGVDVSFIHDGSEECDKLKYNDCCFPVLRSRSSGIFGSIDTAVATLYTTVEFVQNYPNIKKRLYLVQGKETMFPATGSWDRVRASQSYIPIGDVSFITISRWCQGWLKSQYGAEAKYAPNGIDSELFYPTKREFLGKIRILVEGNSVDSNKNVDESFKIIEMLDSAQYEIWYISYQGKAKEWYRVDRFFRRVPNQKMPDIYRQCHILLKTSILESFSYPPLEMMATGGLVVARANEGNVEYLKNEYNCLFYDPENLETAVEAIKRLSNESKLRKTLIINGIETAKAREWKYLKQDILALYE